jgi:8-oxo-dGTP pyrophosphatase MutT (NUDIX family)
VSRDETDPNQACHDEGRQRRAAGRRAVRPRDAATLVLVRRDPDGRHRVLMGQRHASHKFMPNKFVFPGGRVDPADGRIEPVAGLRPAVMEKLCAGCPPTKARALAMAAIRETFEETGLLVGEAGAAPRRTRSEPWAKFMANGVVPRLDILDYVARAVTPPYRDRRFDARFFMADATHIQGDVHDTSGASGELLEIHWVPLDEAQKLDLPTITHVVIDEVARRLRQGDPSAGSVPFFITRHGKRREEAV